MSFSKFEDIEAWQESRALNILINEICKRSNVKKDVGFVDQIQRACLSIMSNIAEGNDSQSDIDFAKYLGYAKRSATEIKSQMYYALDKDYISQNEFNDLSNRADKISSQLAKLIRYLYLCKRKRRTTTKNYSSDA